MHGVTHSLCRFERLDHIVGRGGETDLGQNRVDEELVMCLGIAGTAVGNDHDSVARIGAGANRSLDREIGPHAHQHQRLDHEATHSPDQPLASLGLVHAVVPRHYYGDMSAAPGIDPSGRYPQRIYDALGRREAQRVVPRLRPNVV